MIRCLERRNFLAPSYPVAFVNSLSVVDHNKDD